jgi:hypothetical protein
MGPIEDLEMELEQAEEELRAEEAAQAGLMPSSVERQAEKPVFKTDYDMQHSSDISRYATPLGPISDAEGEEAEMDMEKGHGKAVGAGRGQGAAKEGEMVQLFERALQLEGVLLETESESSHLGPEETRAQEARRSVPAHGIENGLKVQVAV